MRTKMGVRKFDARVRRVTRTAFDHLNPGADRGKVQLRCVHCGAEKTVDPWAALHTGRGRAVCACNRKKTGSPALTDRHAWQAKLDSKYGKNEYVMLTDRVVGGTSRFRHSCGIAFTGRVQSLLRSVESGARCPCTYKKPTTTKQLHVEELRTLHDGDFSLARWGGAGKPLHTYRHRPCGRIHEQRRLALLARNFCPHCHGVGGGKKNRITLAELQLKLDSANAPGEYQALGIDYETRYVCDKTVYAYRVEHDCGHEFRGSRELLQRGRLGRCPACYGNNRCSRDVVYEGKTFRVRGYEETTLKTIR